MGVVQKLELFRRNQEELRPLILTELLDYVAKFNVQLEDKIELFKTQVLNIDKRFKKNQLQQKDIIASK
jgi:hypothetical protein